ncbi:hypothetical protein [Pedobacter sp.]|uniref:hypothetical protein n=1 Tax=Pedobacter sp. TaxID=1411316 RepID=UPI0031DCF7EE
MTLKEANDCVKRNQDLIGSVYNDTEILRLAIIPINPKILNEAVRITLEGKQNWHLIKNETEFSVIGVLKSDDNLGWEYLSTLLSY